MVFMVFVENSSPVRPWTINGQGPSVVPSVATAQCGSASARLHRLITQNGAARSAKLVTGSAAMAKSGLAAARSRLLYQ
jgi:hypothetical protein